VGSAQGIALAIEEMTADRRAQEQRQRRALVLERGIRALDVLIDDLEQLNMCQKRRVPPSWQARLALVTRQMPIGLYSDLKVGVSPMRLLNEVYELQEQLFQLKSGRELEVLRAADDQIDSDFGGVASGACGLSYRANASN
jgi:hypothetical protein